MSQNNQTLSSQGDPVHDFAARVRELRLARRMSQASLAGAMTARGLGWYQTTVHRIETGRQTADLTEIVALAEIFAVPASSLLPPQDAAS